MVSITKVEANRDSVIVEFLTNGITISTLVTHTMDMTPQEIVDKGYKELRPHIDLEISRLNLVADHTLPTVEDEVISIELFGLNNITFTEGQDPIEMLLRCGGKTLYGKNVVLTDEVEYSTSNPIIINPTESYDEVVTASYGEFISTKSCSITYLSLAEIDAMNEQVPEEPVVIETVPTTEEVLGDLIQLLTDKGVIY